MAGFLPSESAMRPSRFCPHLLLLAAVAACGGDGPAAVPGDATTEPSRIEVAPEVLQLRPGDEAPLSVRAYDAGGRPLPVAPPATFRSDDPAVASVSTAGVVTALAAGDTRIRVVWEGLVASVQVAVIGPPVEARFRQDTIVVLPGFEVEAGVVLLDQAGREVAPATGVLAVEDTTVARVTGGRVRGVRPGRTRLTAATASGFAAIPLVTESVAGTIVAGVGTATFADVRAVEILPMDGSPGWVMPLAEDARWPVASPDGTRLAMAGRLGLLFLELGSGTVRLLPGTSDAYRSLEWAPDGRSLLYETHLGWDRPTRLMEVDVAGGGEPRLVADSAGGGRWVDARGNLAWECGIASAMDGAEGICVGQPGDPGSISRIPGGILPAPGPLSGQLAYVHLEFQADEFTWVLNLPGTATRGLRGWMTQPSWSPDGRWLTFAGGPKDAPSRLYAVRADGKHLVWREGRTSARWGPDLAARLP